MTALFNPATSTSFGAALHTQAAAVASKYNCANAANCTTQELIELQWGQSYVTLNPISADPNYTPIKNTTAGWGAYPVYGCEIPVEYYYYME